MAEEHISAEDFRAFVRVRDSGRFNMATQCAAAAQAEGISLAKHIEIMLHFTELAAKYGEVFEKPAPIEKPERRKAAASFKPDEAPNCGYARRAYVVQSRIPAIEKYRNWKTRSGDLGSMKAALQFIEEQKRIRSYSNGPKHRYRIVEKTVSAAVVHED